MVGETTWTPALLIVIVITVHGVVRILMTMMVRSGMQLARAGGEKAGAGHHGVLGLSLSLLPGLYPTTVLRSG